MAKIRWTTKAVAALESIIDFIAKDSNPYATLTAREIFKRVNLLKTNPHLGRIVPELNEPDIREVIYSRYRIVYKVTDHVVEIWTVFHCSQDTEKLRRELRGI